MIVVRPVLRWQREHADVVLADPALAKRLSQDVHFGLLLRGWPIHPEAGEM